MGRPRPLRLDPASSRQCEQGTLSGLCESRKVVAGAGREPPREGLKRARPAIFRWMDRWLGKYRATGNGKKDVIKEGMRGRGTGLDTFSSYYYLATTPQKSFSLSLSALLLAAGGARMMGRIATLRIP